MERCEEQGKEEGICGRTYTSPKTGSIETLLLSLAGYKHCVQTTNWHYLALELWYFCAMNMDTYS